MAYQVTRQALLPLALFAIWMVLTFSGVMDGFDRWGLLVFRDANLMPIGGSAAITLVTGVTHLGDTITLLALSLATIAWLLYRGRRAHALYGALAITGLFLLSPLLKVLFGRARPDIVEHLVHVSSNSFPSGHAIRALAIYLIVYFLIRPFLAESMRKPCLMLVSIIAVAAGLSRLYLGVHWPTDVVASWLVALFWLSLWRRKLDTTVAET
jgi:undecaprenyl-diphosphatase